MKKLILLVLALTLAVAAAGCSPSNEKQEPVTLTVGATPSPHAEVLEHLKPLLAEKGVELEVTVFTDYVLPNLALEDEELDANFFQHTPYLEKFNAERGTNLVDVADIHFEPMGIYGGKSADLSSIPQGAEIGVPSDGVNEARALQLLAAQGIITLKDGVGLEATLIDIVENPHDITFYEAEAALLPRQLADLDFAVVNGNYALDAGIEESRLAYEASDSEGAKLFPNILVVKKGNEEKAGIKELIEALTSDDCRKYIEDNYDGYVVPLF